MNTTEAVFPDTKSPVFKYSPIYLTCIDTVTVCLYVQEKTCVQLWFYVTLIILVRLGMMASPKDWRENCKLLKIDSLGPRTRITADILAELNLLNVETWVKQLRLNHVHKIFYNLCPTYLKKNFVRLNAVHLYDTRSSRYNFLVPHCRSVEHSTFYYRGIADWNSLPDCLKEIEKPREFKASLKKYLTEHHQETEIGDFFFYWLHNVFFYPICWNDSESVIYSCHVCRAHQITTASFMPSGYVHRPVWVSLPCAGFDRWWDPFQSRENTALGGGAWCGRCMIRSHIRAVKCMVPILIRGLLGCLTMATIRLLVSDIFITNSTLQWYM